MNIPGLGEVTGYVEAWRAWNEGRTPELLRSVTMKDEWRAGEPKQACCMDDMCGRHERFGTCGIWATKYRPDFGDYIARVALWGEVIEHEKGYRAEFCYPITFFHWPGKADPARVAKAWGVEIENPTYQELWAYLEDRNSQPARMQPSQQYAKLMKSSLFAMQAINDRQVAKQAEAMRNSLKYGLGAYQSSSSLPAGLFRPGI